MSMLAEYLHDTHSPNAEQRTAAPPVSYDRNSIQTAA